MHRNRIFTEVPIRLPQPSAQTIPPGSFMLCPPLALPGMSVELLSWQQSLYRWAFEQAQAVARPSLPERDLLGVWN